MIKVAIADDHPMIIIGLANMLGLYPDIEIIGTFADGDKLLMGLKTCAPDIILLDLMMPELNGSDALKRIKKEHPDLKVIILTNHGSAIYVNNLVNFGVDGYLLKTADEETLYNAIVSVSNGEKFIEPKLLEKMQQLNEGIKRTLVLRHTLTKRELQVLQLIADGYNTSEIAKTLFLSTHTIDTYRDNMMLKLEAKNAAALVKIAAQSGLISLL